jgi:PKD repeat protein
MKKTNLFFIVSFALLLAACTPAPLAFFSSEKKIITENDSVIFNFTNKSKDATSYLWDFGDGSFSLEESPIHAYTVSGNYIVKLTAYSKGKKKSSERTENVIIEREPFQFRADFNGVEKKIVTDNSDDIDLYNSDYSFPPTYEKKFGSVIGSFGNQYPSFTVEIGNISYSNNHVTLSDFLNFVKIKSYPYSVNIIATGASLVYRDENNVVWTTWNGVANQTGSNFRITYLKARKDIFSKDEIIYKAVFNAKLYDSFGHSMQLTNGYAYGFWGDL